MPELQPSPLLKLPAELRNQIYDLVARDSKIVVIHEPTKRLTLCPPLARACRYLYQEFRPLHDALPLEDASEIIVRNRDCNIWSLVHTYCDIPAPAIPPQRILTFDITFTNDLQQVNVQTFVKELAGMCFLPDASPTFNCRILFHDTFNLRRWRLNFARLARSYRFHSCNKTQRAFEKIYWAFAEAAGKIDGVTPKQFGSGWWKAPGGGLCWI